eukprot:Plantae.Rhodophyta-Purpureofilum_apyrenoidigerum.ctg25030.p1 GENE.Plantae.Rhodophyta-Purpureofilum_apyrenoidigerum.ctg25030~~Plantae.Rhodophyta-Purpureofilum_apyrenoidigerum.ctg25030.p1  ORF type:complete len:183 (-),score=52.74 Plantae.Rhodophyta-Purpureofilum_apyrenoidigerum.ctg25030:330-878(-)
MASTNRRRDHDIMKLRMADFDVSFLDERRPWEFYVKFKGPKETPYEGGTWKVHVELPPTYPYNSPSVGFVNRMYHPNVDESSGSICLDVINQSWSPMYDLMNIFEVFLPQLLTYPNPSDPLNSEAAKLQMDDIHTYNAKVRDYVEKYATDEDEKNAEDVNDSDGFDESDTESEFDDDRDGDL